MKVIKSKLLCLTLVLAMVATACGTAATTETATGADLAFAESNQAPESESSQVPESDTPGDSIDVPSSIEIRQGSAEESQAALDANRALWDSREPFPYTLTATVINGEEVSMRIMEFDVEDNLLSEQFIDAAGVVSQLDVDQPTISVDSLFRDVQSDVLLEWRRYRGVLYEFDPELGVPTLREDLCDDCMVEGRTEFQIEPVQ